MGKSAKQQTEGMKVQEEQIRAKICQLEDSISQLRIPSQAGHGFHGNLDSDSNGSWTAIPRQAGQLEAVA